MPFTEIDKTEAGSGMDRTALDFFFFFALFCFSEHSTHNYLTFMSYNSTIQPTDRFVSIIYFFSLWPVSWHTYYHFIEFDYYIWKNFRSFS